MPETSRKRVLLVQLFSNGDCLIATTVARQIRHSHPDCHLTWAVAASCRSMLDGNPDIDECRVVSLTSGDKEKQFLEFLAQVRLEQQEGIYDEVVVPQILGDNYARYDGCISSSIYRNYGKPITVDTHPVLRVSQEEEQRAQAFIQKHQLSGYRRLILFECAPLSGQAVFTLSYLDAFTAAVAGSETAVIFSSGSRIPIERTGVIDGSVLSIRETVALSRHCHLLIGCSSGITWAVTSVTQPLLPMVQVLDARAYYYNPPSLSFARRGLDVSHILERYDSDPRTLVEVVGLIAQHSFAEARARYHQPVVKNFRIFRGIACSLVRQGKVRLLLSFIRLNLSVHGWAPSLLAHLAIGIGVDPLVGLFRRKKLK